MARLRRDSATHSYLSSLASHALMLMSDRTATSLSALGSPAWPAISIRSVKAGDGPIIGVDHRGRNDVAAGACDAHEVDLRLGDQARAAIVSRPIICSNEV
jgi:uncharacterized membrane protein